MYKTKTLKLTCFLVLALLAVSTGHAQFSKEYRVVKKVELKKGKTILGKLISEDDTHFTIESTDGIEIKIPRMNVKKMSNVLYKPKVPFKFEQNKINYELAAYALPNAGNDSGYGFSANAVYNLNPKYKLGAELGYDVMGFMENLGFYTAKLKLKGVLKQAMWSPYYATSVGYGFGAGIDGFRVISNSGGISYDMLFGITKYKRANANKGFSLFAGYKFQKTNAFIRNFFNESGNELNINFNRSVIGVSFQF